VRSAGHSWTAIADSLGVGKQTLTGFRKRRAPALDAEALLRLCTVWKVPLTFREQTIQCLADDAKPEAVAVLQLQMEFDDSFELRADPTPRAILTRNPDLHGLCLALSDWSAELRLLQASRGMATVAPQLAHVRSGRVQASPC
jgi:hypothetical protein